MSQTADNQNPEETPDFSVDRLNVLGGFVEHGADQPNEVRDDLLKGAVKIGMISEKVKDSLVSADEGDFAKMLARNLDRNGDVIKAAVRTFVQCYSYLAHRTNEGGNSEAAPVLSLLASDPGAVKILTGDLATVKAEYEGATVAKGMNTQLAAEMPKLRGYLALSTAKFEAFGALEKYSSLPQSLDEFEITRGLAENTGKVTALSYEVLSAAGEIRSLLIAADGDHKANIGLLEDFMIKYQHDILDDGNLLVDSFRDFINDKTKDILVLIDKLSKELKGAPFKTAQKSFTTSVSKLRGLVKKGKLDSREVKVPKFTEDVNGQALKVSEELRVFGRFLDGLDLFDLPLTLTSLIFEYYNQLDREVISLIDNDPKTNPTVPMLEVFIHKYFTPLYEGLHEHFENLKAEAEEDRAKVEMAEARMRHLKASPVAAKLSEDRAKDVTGAAEVAAEAEINLQRMVTARESYQESSDRNSADLELFNQSFNNTTKVSAGVVNRVIAKDTALAHQAAGVHMAKLEAELKTQADSCEALYARGEAAIPNFRELLESMSVPDLIAAVGSPESPNQSGLAFLAIIARERLGLAAGAVITKSELESLIASKRASTELSDDEEHLLDLFERAILSQGTAELDVAPMETLLKKIKEAEEKRAEAGKVVDDFKAKMAEIKLGAVIDKFELAAQMVNLRAGLEGLENSGYFENEMQERIISAIQLCSDNMDFADEAAAEKFVNDHWNALSQLLEKAGTFLSNKVVADKDLSKREAEIKANTAKVATLEAKYNDAKAEPIEFRALRAAGYNVHLVGGEAVAWGRKLADIQSKELRAEVVAEFDGMTTILKKLREEGYKGVRGPAGALKTVVKALDGDAIKTLMGRADLGIVEGSSIVAAATRVESFKQSLTPPSPVDKAGLARAGWDKEKIDTAVEDYKTEKNTYAEQLTALSELHRVLAEQAKQSDALYDGMSELMNIFEFAREAGLNEGLPERLDNLISKLASVADRKGSFTQADAAVLIQAYDEISAHIDSKASMSKLAMGIASARQGINNLGGSGDQVATALRAALINLGYGDLDAETRAKMTSDSLKLDRTAVSTGVDAKSIAERASAPVVQAMQVAAFAEMHKSGRLELKRGGKFVPLNRVVVNASDLVQPEALKKLVLKTLHLEEAAALYVAHKEAAGGMKSAQCYAIEDAMVEKILSDKSTDREGKHFSTGERIKRGHEAAEAFINEQESGHSVRYYFGDYTPELDRRREKQVRKAEAQRKLRLLESRGTDIGRRKHLDQLQADWESTPEELRGEKPSWFSYAGDRLKEGGSDWAMSAAATAVVEGGLKGGMRIAGRLANWAVRGLTFGRFNPKAPQLIHDLTRFKVRDTFSKVHGKLRENSDHGVEVDKLKAEIEEIDKGIKEDPNKIQIDGTQVDISSFFVVANEDKAAA